MSGVYIPNMQMPTSCLDCTFYRQTDPVYDYCCISSAVPKSYIPDDCPLIPVPDHGDLIDRDKLMGAKLPNNRVYQGDERISYPPTVWQILDSISKAPTIIPGEEGANGK